MTERDPRIGACGNHCGGCLDFRAQAENDADLQRRVAENINRELNLALRPDQVGCEGCWGTIHTDWAASPGCQIRQCVEEKKLATCADCDEFPCQTYLLQFPADSDCARNIQAIRRMGMIDWLNSLGHE